MNYLVKHQPVTGNVMSCITIHIIWTLGEPLLCTLLTRSNKDYCNADVTCDFYCVLTYKGCTSALLVSMVCGITSFVWSLKVWGNFQACFSPEYRRTTFVMMAIWFSMSFRWENWHCAHFRHILTLGTTAWYVHAHDIIFDSVRVTSRFWSETEQNRRAVPFTFISFCQDHRRWYDLEYKLFSYLRILRNKQKEKLWPKQPFISA